MPSVDKKKLINYWIDSADKDYKTMIDLFNTQNYSWSLFLGHLVVEKLLKALFIQECGEMPPFIHDLRRIAEKTNISIDAGRKVTLDTITRFNINARYDDYKENFYALCTLEFTTEWIEKIKEMTLWIKTLLSK
jgi:HEPN domain-containing protein